MGLWRGSRCTNIGNQEVKTIFDPDMRYSVVGARLKDVQQSLYQMNQELNSVQKSSNIALGRNDSAVVHEIPELFLKHRRQKQMKVMYHMENMRPAVEIPERVFTKRIIRPGR